MNVNAGETFRLVGVADRHTSVVRSDVSGGAMVSRECKQKYKALLRKHGLVDSTD